MTDSPADVRSAGEDPGPVPFPGLRWFDIGDALFFFGRERQTEDLLQRLSGTRFLPVIGSSGCGKSSLVRAGLVSALYRGYMVESTSDWRCCVFRPGLAPIEALTNALAETERFGPRAAIDAALRECGYGLITVVEAAKLAPGESLLLIVDQFEELFRFQPRTPSADALFVSLLLTASEQRRVPIYVVLTMRSEYVGVSSAFDGLAEAFNRSQYLVPRLTREQRRAAIVEPLKFVGAAPAPRLVERVLNDVGDDADQLPVLQHALLRSYQQWTQAGGTGLLDLKHYTDAGMVSGALAQHGTELLRGRDATDLRLIERLFRAVTVKRSGDEGRRPRDLDYLHDLVCQRQPDLERRLDGIIGVDSSPTHPDDARSFADRRNGFLTLSLTPGQTSPVVDLTHESLIRKWPALTEWVRREARSADWYLDLARGVARRSAGEAKLWVDPELKTVLGLRDQDGWTERWAQQYTSQPSFADVQTFLNDSSRAQKEDRDRLQREQDKDVRRLRTIARIRLALILVIVVAAMTIGWLEQRTHDQVDVAQSKYLEQQSVLEQALRKQELLAVSSEGLRQQLASAGSRDSETTQQLERDLKAITDQKENLRSKISGYEKSLAALQTSDTLGKSDRASLVTRIEDLQQRLNDATAERDRLKSDSNGAAYWQARANDAEKQRDALRVELGKTPIRTTEIAQDLRVSQKVKLPLRIAPFNGNVTIYAGNVNDTGTLVIVFPTVLSPTLSTKSEVQVEQSDLLKEVSGACLADGTLAWKGSGQKTLHFTFDKTSYELILTRGDSTGTDQYVAFSLVSETSTTPTRRVCGAATAKKSIPSPHLD